MPYFAMWHSKSLSFYSCNHKELDNDLLLRDALNAWQIHDMKVVLHTYRLTSYRLSTFSINLLRYDLMQLFCAGVS